MTRSHAVYDGDRFIVILPYDGYRMTFTSINSHPLLGTQQCDFEVSPEYFKARIYEGIGTITGHGACKRR